LEQQQLHGYNQNSVDCVAAQQQKKEELLHSEIERLTTAFEGHQWALVFDRGQSDDDGM
jgi:hypothetical protein